jgi:16S rRNA U516 pseudouridylate synthase RsuA-like enzyme
LHREQIGGVVLDAELPPGEWRELSVSERERIQPKNR